VPPQFFTSSDVVVLTSNLFTSFLPKLQNHSQHMQINSNYHYLMFRGDFKMPQKLIFDDIWNGRFYLNQVSLVPK